MEECRYSRRVEVHLWPLNGHLTSEEAREILTRCPRPQTERPAWPNPNQRLCRLSPLGVSEVLGLAYIELTIVTSELEQWLHVSGILEQAVILYLAESVLHSLAHLSSDLF